MRDLARHLAMSRRFERCARCTALIGDSEARGESQLYSPERAFTLCEPCFLEEDAEIEVAGTNANPDLIERYKDNLRN
jgi:hypothetical protein